jgi:hypothetical protein
MHLSHLMPRKARVALAVAVIALAPALAPPGSQAVITSNFDTGDGDLVGANGTDWASVASPPETRRTDLATGSGDNSFGQGTKEDTPIPSVVSGSIPNNKSDLKTFGVYFEDSAQGRYLHMFWHRVQEPSGTTNMDFEFNQSSTISANGVTPVRTAGDVLIQYDLSQGGTNPEIFVSRWVTTGAGSQCEASNSVPCWSDRDNLTDQDLAVGSINTGAISAANADGLGALSARTFGEATIDFDAVSNGEDECEAFAFAYLKSRSSDSFTAAAKDFIAPLNPGINSCGSVKVTKTKKHAAAGGSAPAAGVTFQLKQGATVIDSGVTDANGVVCFGALQPGNYTVHEVVPAGYHGEADKAVTVDGSASCSGAPYVGESVSFVNTPLTDITVSVDSQVNGGTASTIDCHPNVAGVDAATAPNGDGSFTMTDLEPDTYTCVIFVDP